MLHNSQDGDPDEFIIFRVKLPMVVLIIGTGKSYALQIPRNEYGRGRWYGN